MNQIAAVQKNLTPKERYQEDLANGFIYDAQQEFVVDKLDALHGRLVRRYFKHKENKKRPIPRPHKLTPATGLYVWGEVGRGKTYLMDIFFDSLPFRCKMRLHFHRFMKTVHEQLKQKSGKTDPLDSIADDILKEAKVLCFDEFFVSDIGDAILLGTLITKLFDRGITLVTTSNIEPDSLYLNGLQRHRFIPAIDALKKYTETINLNAQMDFRLRILEQAALYFLRHDGEQVDAFYSCFNQLTQGEKHHGTHIDLDINHRKMTAIERAGDVVWFSFSELCETARSQNDYIEIAKMYHTVFVSNVIQMSEDNDDVARRFINMIDEFYDRQVKVIITADVSILELYSSGRLSFEFQRTVSRLQEMQSRDYIELPHLP